MLPALSYHFDLKWPDIEVMPFGELEEYLFALEQINGSDD